MPDYRLITESGDVVAETTLEHDREAVTWRSTHPFESSQAGEGDTRQLHIERSTDDGWIRLQGLGRAETT